MQAYPRKYLCYLISISMMLSVLPLMLLLNLKFTYRYMMPIAVIGGVLSGIPGSNINAILLNVNTPDTRGSAVALSTLTDDIGKGLGPPIIR